MCAFFDREQERKKLHGILESEPGMVYFIYGPINSGKTNLINKVLKELPEDRFMPFYINFRHRNVSTTGDFLNVLFKVDRSGRA